MEATEGSEESEKRQVLDTMGLKKLIAKVKKGDADLAAEIENLKAKVVEMTTDEVTEVLNDLN